MSSIECRLAPAFETATLPHLSAADASRGASYVALFISTSTLKKNKIVPGEKLRMPTQLETTFPGKLGTS